MEIKHLQLHWEDLPKAENVVFQPVEKNYLKIIYAEWLIFYATILIAAIAIFYFVKDIQTPVIIMSVAIVFVLLVSLTFFLANKAFAFKAYAIREKDVMSRSGWLFQKLQVIPIDKIQHCVVRTGPLEKKFDLASLKLFTAGQQSDITLSGLKAEQAEQLKEWIVSKQRNDG